MSVAMPVTGCHMVAQVSHLMTLVPPVLVAP